MTKPLTTLGDALAAKGSGWRAELRAENVERRPPPPNRPDRGYVEQPAERVESREPVPRRREETPVLTAPVALIRFKRSNESNLTQLMLEHADEREEAYPVQDTEPVAEIPPPPPPPAPPPPPEPPQRAVTFPTIEQQRELLQPPPRPQPPEAPMPKAKRPRVLHTEEFKARAVARAMELEEAEMYGARSQTAREFKVHQTNVSNWMNTPGLLAAAKKLRAAPVSREQTQISRPSPPTNGAAASAPVSIPTSIRSGTRTFEVVTRELNEAIELVRALKRELRDMLADAD